ncbi:MAG: carboxypeptidase regulatory-like domain-containing protein [Acidobacteriaceae bacterium]
MRNVSIVVAACFVCFPYYLSAQTPDTATLAGIVQDQTHAVVPGAAVSVTNELTGLHRSAQTNSEGEFSLAGLPVAGTYDVESLKNGFASATLKHITLTGGSAANVVVTLSVSLSNTSITIEGAANDVRIDEPQLGDHLGAMQIEETPLVNRRITYLPLLNAANRPAINQGDVFMNQDLFTTNGAGRRQTWFEVDGAGANDSWGRQTIFTNIPEEAVQEMTVLTSGFSAEYGASTGSVVNIVTKSGGDKLHGDLLGLYRPSGPEAELSGYNASTATSGNDITNDTLAQTAASLSGKLLKHDPTYFFFAGELSQQNRASPVTSPLAPGNFIGHYRDLVGSLRFDRQMSQHNNAFFRGAADGFYDTNPNGTVGGSTLPSVARTFRRRTYTTELGDTAVLTPNLVNNVRLQFQLASPITEFDPVIYGTQFVVPIAGRATFTSGTSQSALLMNHQYELNETLAATFGKHQLTAGGDLIFSHTGGNSKEFGGPIYLGKFTYNTCPVSDTTAFCESSAYLGDISNVQSYQQSYGNANYLVNDALYAIFAQDDYRLSQKLVLNLGIRYEGQTFTDSRTDFAPRVGFDYNPRGTGSTVLRGGFGIYYSQIVDNDEASYALTGPTGVFNYTATPGQVGFPTSIAAAPLPAFPAGAVAPLRSLYIRPGESAYLNQFFPTSTLIGYPSKLLNPYSEQWTLSLEQRLAPATVLSIDYVGTHTVHINRPLDVDPPSSFIRTAQNQTRSAQAANCTRPYWIYWYQQNGTSCSTTATSNPQPPYSVIQSDVNNGYLHYNALDVNLHENFGSRGVMLASYTWSHTTDNVDPDATSQNPNNPNQTGAAERGNALYDQRSRFVLSGYYVAPLQIQIGGIASMAGGLPYNLVTGTNNSGDTGATTDRPVISGVVVGRNTGRGTPVYSVDPFIAREFPLFTRAVLLNLRAEAFNVLNHANFVTFNGTYGNGAAPLTLGSPSYGATAQLPARELQFSAKISF